MTTQVNFYCHFNHTGVGRHCENAYFGMVRNRTEGILVNYVNQTRQSSVQRWLADPATATGVNLFFWRFDPVALKKIPGRRVGWLFFESDRLPPLWLEQMMAFDELWMPSEWARDVLLAHGVPADRIRVVTAGVDAAIYSPRRQPHDGFVFLTVGKYERRKSIDETITAFVEEFPAAQYPQVQLKIKADHPTFPERVAELAARYRDDPRIVFISGIFSDRQMADLYNSADAFVFPSKAEGFGLPTIEALACGLPVVTTDYSAQTAFLRHIPGLFRPVDFDVGPLVDPDYEYFYAREYQGTPYGNWAIPRPASIRAAMREVYADIDVWRARALQAVEIIHARFSWDAVGVAALAAARPQR
jgi:glycosyltransferase involved in cell wall biosynthesis